MLFKDTGNASIELKDWINIQSPPVDRLGVVGGNKVLTCYLSHCSIINGQLCWVYKDNGNCEVIFLFNPQPPPRLLLQA